jgi:hypothetical protein
MFGVGTCRSKTRCTLRYTIGPGSTGGGFVLTTYGPPGSE